MFAAFINYLRFHWNMPAGLKRTSQDFFISSSVTESGIDTFTENQISLPLNSLDREVFVITGIIFDPATPSRVLGTESTVSVQLTRQSATGMQGLNEYNLVAYSAETILSGTAEFDLVSKSYGNQIDEMGQDYIDVIATPDMFLATEGAGNVAPTTSFVRVYGYRAQADVSVYSALVASELNSQ
jgi:hypothetical protein